jgi:glycosyltransferase involved in cell wall biosynthesis
MEKIVFIHYAMRSYRSELFEKLSTELNVDFIFTGCATPYNNVCKEVHLELLKCKNLKYTILPQHNWLPFNGFNFKLFKIPFKYSIIIFSGTLSAPFLILSLLFRIFGMKILIFDELHKWPQKYKTLSFFVLSLLKITNAKILCASTYTSEMYMNKFKISNNNLYITGNPGGDISFQLENIPNFTSSIKKRNIKLLYLGRIIKYKCLHTIIYALDKLPETYILDIYGDGDYEYLQFCKKIVFKLKLNNRVIFHNHVVHNNVAEIINKADIFIHIPFTDESFFADSQTESWGYVINEAVSLNKSIISSTLCPAAFEANKLNLPVKLLTNNNPEQLANIIFNHNFSEFNYQNKSLFLKPDFFIKKLYNAIYN